MRSDLAVAWEFFISLIRIPFTLLLVLCGKKSIKDFVDPFKVLATYMVEAKITFSIIMINCIIFIWSRFWPKEWLYALMDHPNHFISAKIYTLFTATYLHADIAHLTGNMIMLFFLGRIVEERLGTWKFIALYTSVGILASLVNNISMVLSMQPAYSLGASGAIAGIMAAAMLYHPFKITFAVIVPLPVFFIVWTGIYMDATGIINPNGNIAYWAHIGGYLATIFVLLLTDKDDLKKGLLMNLLTLAGVVITSVLVGNL